MNYEEFNKGRFEEAKRLYETANADQRYVLESLFPKLKDEDERIRKVLIDLVKCIERSGYALLNNVTTDSMLAWLEKQGKKG